MKVLIISDAIAPQQGIGSIRWTKLAKYLKINNQDNVEITILTYKKNYENRSMWCYTRDALLEEDMQYFDFYDAVPVKVGLKITNYFKGRVIGSTNHFISSEDTMRHGRKMKIKYRFRLLYENYYNLLLAAVIWNHIKKRSGEFDIVISTYNPIWPTMVASRIKDFNSEIFWLADFRDTCGRDDMDMAGYVPWHKKYTMKHCRLADAVTQVDPYIDTCTPNKVPHFIVTNGYDPAEFLESKDPAHFDFVLTGSVYGKRQDFSVVFRILNELLDEKKIEKEDVSVIYAGRNSGEVKTLAKECGGEDWLIDKGLLPRKQARELQLTAAILIQAAYNSESDRDSWTGKMYEYMMSKKPIVYIINGDLPHSWVTGEISQIGGISYEVSRGDEMYSSLKQYILDKYIEWKNTGKVSIQRNDEYVDNYSYKILAGKIWNIINRQDDSEKRV